MAYSAKFQGWRAISLEDLLVAYRKAKADCFYENAFPTAIKFAQYEQDLLKNLQALADVLREEGFGDGQRFLGECRLLPKKLSIGNNSDADNGHAHFSDPSRAFEILRKSKVLTPEFRVVGDFPVDTHVISALWINMVGHKFDACLRDDCYGARLRRIRNNKEGLDREAPRPFHVTAHTSFEAYFQPVPKDGGRTAWTRSVLSSKTDGRSSRPLST